MDKSKIVKQTIKSVKIECDEKNSNNMKSLLDNPYSMNKTIKKLKKLQKKIN